MVESKPTGQNHKNVPVALNVGISKGELVSSHVSEAKKRHSILLISPKKTKAKEALRESENKTVNHIPGIPENVSPNGGSKILRRGSEVYGRKHAWGEGAEKSWKKTKKFTQRDRVRAAMDGVRMQVLLMTATVFALLPTM